MGFTQAVSDFEYTIHNSQGIVGIKDGKEYLISEEEWQKAYPEHKNTECGECTFVQDLRSLFTFFVPRELKEKAARKPVFVGKFTMPGWIGHSGFYLFKCEACESVVVDYPHGFHGNLLYLRCNCCQTSFDLLQREIYKREGVRVPLLIRLNSMSWKRKRKMIKRLSKRAEQKLKS